MRRTMELNGFNVEVDLKDGKGMVNVRDKKYSVEIVKASKGEVLMKLDGEEFLVRFINEFAAFINGRLMSYSYIEKPPIKRTEAKLERTVSAVDKNAIVSPLAGRVMEVLVKKGSRIKSGQTLALLESMKMLIEVKSDKDGVVEEVLVKRGDVVNRGQTIVRLAESEK